MPAYRARPVATAWSSADSVSSSSVVVAPGVHLPQVDVVGAQPLQRPVQRVEQGPPRGVHDPFAGTPGDAGLGGEDQLLAVHRRAQQAADHPLRLAVAVTRRRVEQRAAGLEEDVELVAGLVLVGVPAPGHRAQGQPADLQAGPAQPALLHGRNLPTYLPGRR